MLNEAYSGKALAIRLGVSVRTVEGWRHKGLGPPWLKLGSGRSARVVYPRSSTHAWEQEQMRGAK
jgi:hypothetical protein